MTVAVSSPSRRISRSFRSLPASRIKAVARELLNGDFDVSKADFSGKLVLVRVDFNVPTFTTEDGNKEVSDWTRVDAAVPTLRLLCGQGAKVVVASHFGRPKPAKMTTEEMKSQFSLNLLSDKLANVFPGAFKGVTESCIGDDADKRIAALENGQILLLENTRFHAGDEGNDDDFAKALAHGADAFVNDAFGVCHRNQGSVTGVCSHVPMSYMGLLIKAELESMVAALDNPKRPLVVIVGGAKVADKLGVLTEMMKIADKVIVGGRMAYTFLAQKGVALGSTHVEHELADSAKEIMELAEANGVEFLLPVDVSCTKDLNSNDICCTRPLNNTCCSCDDPCVPDNAYGADLGPETQKLFSEAIEGSGTIFWNGPMGRFEMPAFAKATEAVAKAVAKATSEGATSIIGGGDSVAALKGLGLEAEVSHVSTGGGASLTLIEGKDLPGLSTLLSSRY